MKYTSTVFIILLFHIAVAVNAQSFSFSQTAKPYTELTGSTVIPKKYFYDTISIGFDFSITGTKSNKIVLTRGWGYFSIFGNMDARFTYYGTELNNGEYSYVLEGAPGSRIFKLQGKNVGFGHDFSFQDYINIQVWLYEADNTMEVYFGKSRVVNMDFDFYFGMGGPAIGFKGLMLTGNANMPTPSTADTARVTGTPSNGKMYSFKVTNLSVHEKEKQPAAIMYPNPASGEVTIITGDKSPVITIYDITGKQMDMPVAQNGNTSSANVSALPAGMYWLRINSTAGVQVQKLTVQH